MSVFFFFLKKGTFYFTIFENFLERWNSAMKNGNLNFCWLWFFIDSIWNVTQCGNWRIFLFPDFLVKSFDTLTFRRNLIFRCAKSTKIDFTQIWVTEKFYNFHTVFQHLSNNINNYKMSSQLCNIRTQIL